jgi:hypothetical protein
MFGREQPIVYGRCLRILRIARRRQLERQQFGWLQQLGRHQWIER